MVPSQRDQRRPDTRRNRRSHFTTAKNFRELVKRGLQELVGGLPWDLMGLRAFPLVPHQNRRSPAMKALVPILTLILALAFFAPAPKSQSACEKAGMNWDATASAPKVKCKPAFA